MKLLFMNRKFHNIAGGVEKSCIALANAITERGHRVDLLSLDHQEPNFFFEPAPGVRIHTVSNTNADIRASAGERLHRLSKIRAIIRREDYDVAMGFQDGAFLSLALAAIGTGVPVIAAERNAPSRFDHMKSRLARTIAFQSFRLARKLVLQCARYRQLYPDFLSSRVAVVPNPVWPVEPSEPAEEKRVLFVGRLESQKNVSVLVEAFAIASAQFPDWTLDIVGDGSERKTLMALVEKRGLNARVAFHGLVDSVQPFYDRCDMFVLPSLFEGFPNALAEAMITGRASIGFACCAGVSDLIEDGRTGTLVHGSPAAEPLAAALLRLMADQPLRRSLGDAACDAMTAYAPDEIFDRWEALFRECARSSS